MVVFQATASDPDIPANELLVEWHSDKDGSFGTSTPSSDGTIIFAYNGLSSDSHAISLNVSDEVGSLCSAQILLNVGNAPIITIDQPLDGSVYSIGNSILFQGTVSDVEDQPNEISTIWTSSIEGDIYNGVANSQGVTQFALSNLSAGLHSITLSAVDTAGSIADELISVRVNTPPVVDSVSLSPVPVYSTDSLSAASSGSDADGDIVTSSYTWLENGIVTGFTGTIISSSELDVGETWTVRATPNDGYIDGNYQEESIVISNTNPIVSSVLITSSGLFNYNDSTLTCLATGTDVDGPVTVSYSWMINGISYSGASQDLSNTTIQPNELVECIATVSDANGGSTSSSTTITIENRAPSVYSVTISPNLSAVANSALTCSATVGDPDGENLSPSYEWFIGGSSVGNNAVLQLTNSIASPNDAVECIATVIDGSSEMAFNSDVVSVGNSDPVIDSSSITPNIPSGTDLITCSATISDVDGGSPSVSFAFTNQSTGASYTATSSTSTSASLDLSSLSVQLNDVIACEIIVSDSDGGTVSTTETATISNSPPSFSSEASISPSSSIYTGTQLTCTALAIDDDDGSVTPTYVWMNAGIQIGTGGSYIVAANNTDVGDSILCTATATDSNQGFVTSSTYVVVENSNPTVSNVQISGSYYNDQTQSCTATTADVDGSPTVTYAWSSGGLNLGSAQSLDLSTTALLPLDSLTCMVTVSDANGGSAQASTSATIGNRAPSSSTVSITWATTGPSPEVSDSLTCAGSGAVDPDGQSLSYSYSWTSMSGATASGTTVSSSQTSLSETWTCTVTASDGNLTSQSSTSATINVPYSNEWENCAGTQTINESHYKIIGESTGDFAGSSVASAGDVDGDGLDDVLIGAYQNDDGGLRAGKAYLFLASSLGSSNIIDLSQADYFFIGENADDYAGRSVSSAGDVDGDGLSDILIGAYQNDDGGGAAGKAYLILASSLGSNTTIALSNADYAFIGENAGDYAGYTLAKTGDIDGDNLNDILIGAYGNDDGGSQAGKVYLVLSSSLGSSTTIDLSNADYAFEGEASGDYAGYSIAGFDDVNGDGSGDILIGAYGNDDGGSSAGKAYLFFGTSLGSSSLVDLSQADYSFVGEDYGEYAGYSVSDVSDIDGDGLDEIVIASPENDDGGPQAGKVYLIFSSSLSGTTTIDLSTADYAFVGETTYDYAGYSVSLARDVDGDGLGDILIGAPYNDEGGSDAGKVYLILGSSLGSSSTIDLSQADYSMIGDGSYDHAGTSVSSAGDMNGDGYDEILIGVPDNDDGGSNAGTIGLFSSCENQ